MHREVNHLSDDALIEGVIREDSACQGALYERYFQKVNHQCLALVKDRQTAFDLSQDILMKAFARLSSFRREASFGSWLWAIGHNHCKEYMRRNRLYFSVPLETENNISIATQEGEQQVDILALLEQLAVKDRDLLILKYGHGVSIQKIQEMYQLSESAVKMRLSRAKEKLIYLFYQRKPYHDQKNRSLPL